MMMGRGGRVRLRESESLALPDLPFGQRDFDTEVGRPDGEFRTVGRQPRDDPLAIPAGS